MKNLWTVCLFVFLSINQSPGGNAACNNDENVNEVINSLNSHFRGKTEELKKCYQPRVLFYEFMGPKSLVKHQDFIREQYELSKTELTFAGGANSQGRLLRIPLIPANVLSKNTSLTIKLEVEGNRILGKTQDMDISYGISDGVSFMGIETRDQVDANYSKLAPCGSEQGKSGITLIEPNSPGTSLHVWNEAVTAEYPKQFEITLKPNRPGSSCSILHNNVKITRPQTFTVQLSLENGLYLEVYGDNMPEKSGIGHIAVQVIRDN